MIAVDRLLCQKTPSSVDDRRLNLTLEDGSCRSLTRSAEPAVTSQLILVKQLELQIKIKPLASGTTKAGLHAKGFAVLQPLWL